MRLFFVLNEKFARSELSSQEKAAQGLSSFSSCYQRSEKEAVASGKKGRFGLPGLRRRRGENSPQLCDSVSSHERLLAQFRDGTGLMAGF